MTSITWDTLRQDLVELKANFEKFSSQTMKIINSIEEELTNASNDQKEWKDVKRKLAMLSMKGKVKLDVGGDIYSTSVETLTREKETLFTPLFSEQWELQRDPDDKSIFIDRNGKLFIYILDYLRNGEVSCGVINDEVLRRNLIAEAKYFRLHNLIQILTEPERTAEAERITIESSFSNSTLLEYEHRKKLNAFYGVRSQRWELIYKASRDGFDANAFHSRCNNKGPTMALVRSNNNYLFGGYTSVAWTSVNQYDNDTQAFLFTLPNPHNIAPTKYQIDPSKAGYAVKNDNADGPRFGSGDDLRLYANSNSNNSRYFGFPTTYIDTTGKGNNTFTGARNFTTSDIEVFKLA